VNVDVNVKIRLYESSACSIVYFLVCDNTKMMFS